jgi:hypothetical protein
MGGLSGRVGGAQKSGTLAAKPNRKMLVMM